MTDIDSRASVTTAGVAECGCAGLRLSRRGLLAGAGAGIAATSFFGDVFREVAYGAAPGGNVLVVLSLRGGVDGLSLVVPRGSDHDVLSRLRPGIALPEASLLGDDSRFGLHPEFAPLMSMWTAGTFGAVHGVGLPVPNRSHFEAMELVEDADPGSSARRGWLNRLVGLSAGAAPEDAVQLGSSVVPTSLVGPAPAIGTRRLSDLELGEIGRGTPASRGQGMKKMWAGHSGPMPASVAAAASISSRLGAVADAAANTDSYPSGALRNVLADTAALIKADVGTQVVTVDYGGWDMHTNVGLLAEWGTMRLAVSHLAGSLAAFFADLGPTASRVTVVTLSEFGRRVQENGSGGLDHGYGNAMLLLGAGVNGGGVRGGWKGLDKLTDGDVSVSQDYRSVLAEIVASRFPELSVSKIFPGFTRETVGAMT